MEQGRDNYRSQFYPGTRRNLTRYEQPPFDIDVSNLTDFEIASMIQALDIRTRRRFCTLNPRLIGICQFYNINY